MMNPDKSIKTIMTTDLVTAQPDDAITRIRSILEKHDFHHLPVVNKEEALVGIISKEDYLKIYEVLSLNTNGINDETNKLIKAKDIMTKYPMSLDPDDTIGLAADVFLANKFHALPVVQDEQLVGIITTHDLLSYSFSTIVTSVGTERYTE